MLRRTGTFLAERLRRYIPDSFVFALALTLLTAVLAWAIAGASPGEVLDAWYGGFWKLLEFGMQMALMLATGYAIALSPPVARAIDVVASRVRTPARVYLVVMVLGGLLNLVSWGWVVIVAVLARELASRVEDVDYAYLTACVYVSSWSWVCGLSSSIPLLLNTEDNFLIRDGVLDSTLGVEATLGSATNLLLAVVGLVALTAVMFAARPRRSDSRTLAERLDESRPPATTPVREEAEGQRLAGRPLSDRLDHGALLTAVICVLGLIHLGRRFAARGFDIDLEVMIFVFLMVGMAAHRTPMRYVVAMKRACSNVSGILFQYPFYAGIMGIMTATALGSLTARWIAEGTSLEALPAVSQLLGAVVNFAIPSAGGEWAVIGPPLVETTRHLAVDATPDELRALLARVSMAAAYGESSTNLLQPFFLLSILPVMGAGVRLHARDVMGHLVLPFVVLYGLTFLLVTFVPL